MQERDVSPNTFRCSEYQSAGFCVYFDLILRLCFFSSGHVWNKNRASKKKNGCQRPCGAQCRSQMRTLYLVSGPSVDDRLDEDAQVLPGLSGLVALQADPQAGRSRFIEGDLVHQLLPAVLQHQTASLFAFLEDRKTEETGRVLKTFTQVEIFLEVLCKKLLDRKSRLIHTHLIPTLHNNCCI